MLYRYYRYILIIKILLLVCVGYLLFQLRHTPVHNWWTLFLLSQSNSGDIHDFLSKQQTLPDTPWAVLVEQSNGITLHVPWTNDTWYIVNYIVKPLPTLKQTIDWDTYIYMCKYKVTTQRNTLALLPCQIDRNLYLWWTIILFLVALLL